MSLKTQIEMFQIIEPEGSYNEALEPSLTSEELKKLYRLMVYTRIHDIKATMLQRQGRASFYASSMGQEATHIGSAFALSPEDWIVPQFREPGVALLRGMPLRTMIAHLFGNVNDLFEGHNMPNMWADKALNIVSPSAPVGSQLPMAVGIAMAAKYCGDKIVALTYFGDGATSTHGFHSAMNFAGVFRAPLIFVCQNNQWAISLPVKKQTASKNIAIKAGAYGFDGIRVDGNDILAVYKVTKEAVEKARRSEGPTLIEAVTYRLGAHSTADDPKKYRSEQEVEEWKRRDPIIRFKQYLEKKKLLTDDEAATIEREAEQDWAEAIKAEETVPPPPIESLFDCVYVAMPWHLEEQKKELLKHRRNIER